MFPAVVFKTMEMTPFAPSRLASPSSPKLLLLSLLSSTAGIDPHDICDIEVYALMQAASRITKNAIVMAVRLIFLARAQLGSITNGSNSSYVRLVVIPILEINSQQYEIRIKDSHWSCE